MHRSIWRRTGLALALGLCACGSKQDGSTRASAPAAPTYKLIDGYNGYRLGSSFEDALHAGNATDLFSPLDLRDCFKDLALKGCSLHRKSDDTVFDMRDGIPYALGLTFDKHDRLTRVQLNYHRESTIASKECTELFGRTIDWMVKDYGPFAFRRADDPPNAYRDSVMHVSPGGTTFATLKADRNGFVSQFMHNASEKVRTVNRDGKKIYEWSEPHAGLFFDYLIVGRGICDINVDFGAADAAG